MLLAEYSAPFFSISSIIACINCLYIITCKFTKKVSHSSHRTREKKCENIGNFKGLSSSFETNEPNNKSTCHNSIKIYWCPVNTDNFLSDRLLHLYKPLIEIQPKEYKISMFKRTRISRITRIKGRVSQTMRDEYFLIRGEYHEFYHPDGIRAIRMR